MLVIRRRFGERLVIGDSISIQLVDVRGGEVRLGVVAPRDVPVYREEILPPGHPMTRPADPPAPSPAD